MRRKISIGTNQWQNLPHSLRQAEWEEVVGKFQKCGKGATSDEKWHMMDIVYLISTINFP